MTPNLATKYTCTGCMACVDSCGFSALNGEWADDGHLYVIFREDRCTGCGNCEKSCPVVNDFSYESEKSTSTPYAAWANDDAIRMKSSSGGIFAAIAYHIIRYGGYVAGAVMDGIKVRHIISNNQGDIARMQGSKYQQGDSTGIYCAVKEKLKENHLVFFSGVPCQVAGLYSFLGKLGDSDLLLTSDLVCSGFPSSHFLQRFVKYIYPAVLAGSENPKKINVSYRNKNEGWEKSQKITVRYCSNDRIGHGTNECAVVDYAPQNFVFNGFLSGYSARYSCGDCQFTKLNRKADLTLADFWNDKTFLEEHYKGVSCVVTHSHAGRKILEKVDVTLHAINWKEFLPYNKMVYRKLPFLKIHPARRLLAWNFAHLPIEILGKIYGGKIKNSEILWLPYKIFNFILWKIGLKIRNKYNNEFLKTMLHE